MTDLMTDPAQYCSWLLAMRANKKRYEDKYGKIHTPIATYEVLIQGAIRGRFSSKKELKGFLEQGKGEFDHKPHLYAATVRGYNASGGLVFEKEKDYWKPA